MRLRSSSIASLERPFSDASRRAEHGVHRCESDVWARFASALTFILASSALRSLLPGA